MTSIRLHQIIKNYPKFQLQSLNLHLPSAMVVGLIGENGAGKTTLIRIILGITKPDTGIIYLDEKPIENHAKANAQLGFMLGDANVWESMKAVDVGKFFEKVYPGWDQGYYLSLLQRLHAPIDTPVKHMSTGNKQKIQVATALSHNAKYLLLDEPTSGLDPIARREVLSLIHEEAMNREMGVLISSHITTDLESIADYLVMIHNGTLLLEGAKDELLENHYLIQWPIDYAFPTSGLIYAEQGPFGNKGLWRGALPPKETVVSEPPTIEDLFYYYTKAQRRSA